MPKLLVIACCVPNQSVWLQAQGHTKEQATFARVSGYVEQTDIHSPQVCHSESAPMWNLRSVLIIAVFSHFAHCSRCVLIIVDLCESHTHTTVFVEQLHTLYQESGECSASKNSQVVY